MYDMTLAELVQGKPTTSMPMEVYADMIRDKIADVEEIERECEDLREDLRGRLADLTDVEDKLKKAERENGDFQDKIDKLTKDLSKAKENDKENDDALETLRELVAAIDGAKIGRVVKVGALIVVAESDDLASKLGEALVNARALL